MRGRRIPNGGCGNIWAAALKRLVSNGLGGGIANPPLSTQAEQLEAVNSTSIAGKSSEADPKKKEEPARSPINGIGNIFLLGMTVLASEIIDLTAAKSLEYLLEPCLPKDTENVDLEVLAEQAGLIDLGLEEGEFIPISFE